MQAPKHQRNHGVGLKQYGKSLGSSNGEYLSQLEGSARTATAATRHEWVEVQSHPSRSFVPIISVRGLLMGQTIQEHQMSWQYLRPIGADMLQHSRFTGIPLA